ncbi:LytR C-terminal domain-containing protein [Nocardioides coralli]|uniref:LytR C-terminal domain-containing protein n=1 Tax=Nocardioides coralli TaxID=2872154 RepID=UPI001CA3ABFC|nr:LytR C-terminal domain-containing protein [Nocardioides coralli]QZY29327.1 LytR C-terminal domain-containing protein [Nocardioides coralli]
MTLLVLGGLLVLATVWGWSALTEPFPEKADPPICVDRDFEQGDTVARRDVTVSVWNASNRNGLAGLTMDLLTDVGFSRGQEGNAPDGAEVKRVQVWTGLPKKHPAVRLVARKLGKKVKVVDRTPDVAGVLVVVGNAFDDLAKGGPRKVQADESVVICGPPAVS